MAAANPSLALRAWSALTWMAHPFLGMHLQKRIAKGKEDPDRWREKLGESSVLRPEGTVVWLHAVGLGEVLALRGLVGKLHGLRPDWHFLVTSGTRASAKVFAQNMPPKCIHQFLPLDTPQAAQKFLDHWSPQLAIWAEQELWPGLIYRTDARNIPMALVNARMNAASFAKRKKARAVYADALSRFAIVSAQDEETARNLVLLGASDVATCGSLKPIAPPLDASKTEDLKRELAKRFVWVAASSHPADEAIALAAHRQLLSHDPSALLIIAPRDIVRGESIVAAAEAVGLTTALRSQGEALDGSVYVADTFGELGQWYRLAQVACIGGTFDDTEGHNPWEAVALDTRVLHGPRTANFAADFAALNENGGATLVADADALSNALMEPDHEIYTRAASHIMAEHSAKFDKLSGQIVALVETS